MRMLALGCLALLIAMSAPAGACQLAERGSAIRLKLPVEGRITSGFGMRRHPILQTTKMHTGTDWAAELGAPVHASAAGEVTKAGREGEYGNLVVITHGGGVETAYAHLSRIDVKEGDCVAQGVPLGGVGSTGLTGSVALHFEVRRDGRFVDPIGAIAETLENARP
jgi:murein DD-endopeptidase MepM/ murein hydrolase activator NlpD